MRRLLEILHKKCPEEYRACGKNYSEGLEFLYRWVLCFPALEDSRVVKAQIGESNSVTLKHACL